MRAYGIEIDSGLAGGGDGARAMCIKMPDGGGIPHTST